MKCVICHSEEKHILMQVRDTDRITDKLFTISKCNNCGLVCLDPTLNSNELKPYYFEEYYGKPNILLKTIVESFQNIFQNFRFRKITLYKKNGKILDVGCGDGTFLNYMNKKKWDCYGVEPSPAGVKLAVNKKGLKIYSGELLKIGFTANSFDVITFWQSFEHIADPITVLKEIQRIIKRDGIVLISLPNIMSLESRIGRDRWFHLDPPRHQFFYSPDTLKRMLEIMNLKAIKVNHYSLEYNIFGILQTLLNKVSPSMNFFYNLLKRNKLNPKDKKLVKFTVNSIINIFLIPILFLPALLLAYLASGIKKGGVITVYAKKIKNELFIKTIRNEKIVQ